MKPRRVIVCSFIEMFTIRPPPAVSIRGTTARATRKHPVTLVASTSPKPSGLTSQNGWGSVRNCGLTVRMPIPALLTSRSRPPSNCQTSSTADCTEDGERTSNSRPTACGPSPAAVACARQRSRPLIATWAPASASATAIA